MTTGTWYENVWIRNLLFGALLFVLITLQNEVNPESPHTAYGLQLLFFIVAYGLLAGHNVLVVRRFLLKRKYIQFALLSVVYCLGLAALMAAGSRWSGVNTSFLAVLLSTIFILLAASAIYFIHLWISENVIESRKKLLAQTAELNFLKQQLSPHFLFNSLNNLYGTALTTPELVADKILQLSDLLRYQVEATTRPTVRLDEEMEFCNRYLQYASYRNSKLTITRESTGIAPEGRQIPPLLFLPLLENAVKFVAEAPAQQMQVRWMFVEEMISFSITNSCRSEGPSAKGTGLGLENLKKRLALMNARHTLTIDNTPGNYAVRLQLW